MTIFALLLAAGSSERFRASHPSHQDKLFVNLRGRELWRNSYDTFATHSEISAVGIVCSQDRISKFQHIDAAFVVEGGQTRRDSCLAGLSAIPDNALVLVHDAARPFVTHNLISRVIDAATEHEAAIPCMKVVDTVKAVQQGFVHQTLDRNMVYLAQTPQAARKEVLLGALESNPDATDESSALEAAGVKVAVVEGEDTNIKVTTAADLRNHLAAPQTLVGSGFDIHAFSADSHRRLILGGVEFDGERGLEGHSDADVVLHALTDALLGAIGEGDIGMLFPNTDPSYKDADSLTFLRDAVTRMEAIGRCIVNADITVLAEEPKLGARRDEIRHLIAKELCVSPRRVNVKATTMEGLGAIGRKEGIAAMATVTVAVQ